MSKRLNLRYYPTTLSPHPPHAAATTTISALHRLKMVHQLLMASQETQHQHNWHYTEFDDRNFQIRGSTLFSVIVIFTVILLISILFLYARWFCRYRHLRAAASGPGFVHAPPSQSQGLDPSTINSFPIVLHQSSTKKTVEESECCICLGAFEDGEKVKVLPKCDHVYHPECVDKWLRDQPSCPLCRSSLRVDSPV